MEYINITGTNKIYYKAGDRLDPTTDQSWGADMDTIQIISTDGSFDRYGRYFDTWKIHDGDEEGCYTITRWSISNANFNLSLAPGVSPVIYILKTPVAPTVDVDIDGLAVTLTWSTPSIGISGATIDWGDGSSEWWWPTGRAMHTYSHKGAYRISVTLVNECDEQSLPTVTTVMVGPVDQLLPHPTIYLLDNMKIVKPINATYRIVYEASKTTATFTLPYDPDIRCGMQIYLYHMFPQVFTIESVSGERTVSVICVDYLTALLRGRVAYTGTTSADGYRTYTGNAAEQIVDIINDNLIPLIRGDPTVLPRAATTTAPDISIKARYNQVSSLLEDAVSQSGLTLKSTILYVSPLVISCDVTAPQTRNILLDSHRLCGEMQSQAWVRKATTALVAGSGKGAERETAWRGDLVSSGTDRYEMYVDGGDSTETTALDNQAGDNVSWKLSSNSPYKPYRDFWVGDRVYINETTTMVITQIDYAMASNGESYILTLGRPYNSVDKTVYDMQGGIAPDYR